MNKALLAALGALGIALAAAVGASSTSSGRLGILDDAAVTYFVAPDGDDAHDGRSPRPIGGSRGPYRTLRRAAAAVRAGDTVAVRGGTYDEASTWTENGAEGRPITIEAYKGEAVLISGRGHAIPPGTYGSLLHVAGRWITVRGLDVGYSSWYGVTVSGEHCTVDRVFAHHNWSSGIVISGSYGLIVDCRAFNNSLINERYRPHDGTWGFGISACRHPTSTTIRRSVAWDNWGEGISTFESTRTTIEDCTAYNNQQNFYISDTTFCTFRRNLSYFTPGNMIQKYEMQTGILMGDEKRNPASSSNTVVNNLVWGGERNIAVGHGVFENGLIAYNTFVNASPSAGAESANVWINAGRYRNARFVNNIVAQDDRVAVTLVDARGIVFEHNLWARKPASRCRGTGDIVAKAGLAAVGAPAPGTLTPDWFRLLKGSPAIDRAKPLPEILEDFFRTVRGPRPDIGALEYSALPAPSERR